MIFSKGLQHNNDEGHQRLDKTELQGGLFAEAEEADGVGFAVEAAGAVSARRADWLASDLAHDVSFTAKVLIAQAQEVVDYKCCRNTRR